MIEVEVVYAQALRQEVRRLRLEDGATVAEALRLAGLDEIVPADELARCRLGIFGRIVEPGQRLEAGDRVELYRPLVADPKLLRRQRASKASRA